MRYARIYPWRRTRLSRGPLHGQEAFFVAQFSAGYTTNMFGFDLRQGQALTRAAEAQETERAALAGHGLFRRKEVALFWKDLSVHRTFHGHDPPEQGAVPEHLSNHVPGPK